MAQDLFEDFCVPAMIPKFLDIAVNICLLICSVLNVANFAQWKRPNATVTLFFATAITAVIRDTTKVISWIPSNAVITQILILTFNWLSLACDIAWIWTLVLLSIFHLKILQLGRQTTEKPGSAWSIFRARIGVGVVTGAALALILPLIILVRKPEFAEHYLYVVLVRWVVRSLLPGLVLLCVGSALLVARRRAMTRVDRSTVDSDEEDTETMRKSPSVKVARRKSGDVEKQLTRVVVVIVLVLGIVKVWTGFLALVEKAATMPCDFSKTVRVFDFIAFMMNAVPFITYVCALSQFREVFRRCCRRS